MTSVNVPAIRERWNALWLRLGVARHSIPAIDPLLQVYTSPARHYHNLGHIEHCLRELDDLRQQCEDANAVELAIWFHDIVYDPKRHDNEERSLDEAVRTMRDAGVSQSLINAVSGLILATKHTGEPEGHDARILTDIDLSILGQPEPVFDEYDRAIRREYGHISEKDFVEGRARILRQFLERPSIYSTPEMKERYEVNARKNLAADLKTLSGIGSNH